MLIKRKEEFNPLDKKTLDNLRVLAIDIIDNAKSGHPGICLGAAPIIYTLFLNHLKFDPNNSKWLNRDRFILSSGHASSLLYATLYMAGYNISLDDLKNFRKIDSNTPGHPELNVTDGVDISTGPLGQGIANSVGVAISEKYLRENLLKDLVDFNTYVLCGDGDLMEGISYEAMSLAGKLKLNKLIVLYDSNNVTLDGDLSNTFNENIKLRMESMNWNYILVSDSEDLSSINDAINKAKLSDKPTLIEVKTTIGKYSVNEGTNLVHGKVLDEDDIKQIKDKLNIRDIPFQVSNDALTYFRDSIITRNIDDIDRWVLKYENTSEELRLIVKQLLKEETIKLKDLYYEAPIEKEEATRVTSGKILNSISEVCPLIIGGSCDVSNSTYAKLNDSNRYIDFGVREHSSAAICNGIASVGLIPFTSTFLSFSDYMKPSIRMSAMMNLPVIYIFSHDSITVGEDGPTHQPIEQLIALRSIPNLDVYRPSDANEVLGAYKSIFENNRPAVIVLGRNKVPLYEDTKVNNVKNGAYNIKELTNPDGIIISSGEEMKIALDVSDKLQEKGINLNVVSMPSIELFEKMDDNYKNDILINDNVFVIELSSSYSWYKYVKNKDYLFTIDEFGKSGNYIDVLDRYNFNREYIENKIEELLK